MQTDWLFFNCTATAKEVAPVQKPSFARVDVGVTKKVVVYHAILRDIEQSLDLITWDTTAFLRCAISCDGRPFELTQVSFRDCTFVFADSFPEELRSRFQNEGLIDLEFD
jgi:hypothetical protein